MFYTQDTSADKSKRVAPQRSGKMSLNRNTIYEGDALELL